MIGLYRIKAGSRRTSALHKSLMFLIKPALLLFLLSYFQLVTTFFIADTRSE